MGDCASKMIFKGSLENVQSAQSSLSPMDIEFMTIKGTKTTLGA